MLTLAHHGVAIRPVCPVRTRIWSVGFCRGRKTGKSGEKISEQEREPSTNSTHMTPGLGFEYGPHWWEASAWNSRSGGLSLPRDSLVFFFRGGGGELASRSELSAVWGGRSRKGERLWEPVRSRTRSARRFFVFSPFQATWSTSIPS